jgi:hypothetical protein
MGLKQYTFIFYFPILKLFILRANCKLVSFEVTILRVCLNFSRIHAYGFSVLYHYMVS